MEASQVVINEYGTQIEISALFMLTAEVETAVLPQLNTFAHGSQSSAETTKNIMM